MDHILHRIAKPSALFSDVLQQGSNHYVLDKNNIATFVEMKDNYVMLLKIPVCCSTSFSTNSTCAITISRLFEHL